MLHIKYHRKITKGATEITQDNKFSQVQNEWISDP